MTSIQIIYKNYLKNGLISDGKASILRILSETPDVLIQEENDCHGEWTVLSNENKEIYENEIFNPLFDEIPEVDHQAWEDTFGTDVNFMLAPVSTETLSAKCRKKRPQV